jgi:DNA (cytosine-5)-methyltransferase 1
MRYGSVCSGIEAATAAWHSLGWEPAWFSEIEPFPSAVLKHHYPTVPNYGDMTKFEEWPDEPINLLVGGTPCQSFSVAGLRRGLADPRGNLMLTYLAIAQRHRPQWLVWENVPGVLSSNGGRDFGTFLGALGELGYGFAYRVLDAQWFGVAQRRRRVFVIGYLGDWQRAAEVLFESESVCRNPAPSREKRQDVAGTIAARFGISRNNHEECVAQTLLARRERFDLESETPVVAPTLQANDGAKWGSNQWIDEGKAIVQPIGFGAQMSNPQTDVDLMQTLNAKNPMAVAQPTYGIPGNWIGRQPENGGNAVEPMHDVSPCLTKTDRHGVAQPYVGGVDYENNAHTMDEPTGPLLKGSPTGGGRPLPAIATAMQVRRLTPVECERLQGFPDNYTNIPWRKSAESPDGPRYKALGNSMAVPVMRWIGERINKMEQR